MQARLGRTVLLVLIAAVLIPSVPLAQPILRVQSDRGAERVREAEQFSGQDKIAIIVAIEEYLEESGFRALDYAVEDGEALAATLDRQGYLVKTFYNHRAKKHFILDAIDNAGKLLNPDQGTLVFFFAGHGYADWDSERNQRVNYLAVDGTTTNNLAASGLKLEDVRNALENKARRRVMFIDACRNNSQLYGRSQDASFIEDDSEGFTVLYSTKFGDFSYEHPTLKHGVFSYFLDQGLNGAAAGADRVVTFDDLARYVEREVKNWTYTKLNRVQRPYRAGERTGPFVLASFGTPLPPTTLREPLRSGGFGPEMILIRGNRFQMGSAEEGGGDVGQKHWVSVTDFYIGRYEITVAEYRRFIEASGYHTLAERSETGCKGVGERMQNKKLDWKSVGFVQTDDHPVACVSWYDAVAYTDWLSQETGANYRLPTEAEWEYAARGGNNTAYWWGEEASHEFANYGESKKGLATGLDRWEFTSPVDAFKANSYGLFNILGNVGEWTCSEYSAFYNGKEQDCFSKINLIQNGSPPLMVIRGGTWMSDAVDLRSDYRYESGPAQRYNFLGFRAARSP